MRKVILAACLTLLVAAAGNANAAISVNTGNFSYSQNFDSLAPSGASNTWTNDSTLAGWSLFRQPAPGGAITAYAADNGGSNTGSFYSYGITNGPDRALGGLGSGGTYWKAGGLASGTAPANGTAAGWIAVALKNDTNTTLNSLKIGFDGEQWRNAGYTTAQPAQIMTLQYGFGSTFGAVTDWSTPGGNFDFASPIATSTAGALNGNATANRVAGLGGSLTNLAWASNDTLWVRWIENNDAGNDNGLAIDNVNFEAVPTPIPAAAWLLGSGLLGLVGIRRRQN